MAPHFTDRRRGKALDVPTAHYVHANGRRIDVIGVKHYGSSDFWQTLQTDLDALSRTAEIHYEFPVDDSATWSHFTKLKSDVGRVIDRATRQGWRRAGYVYQFEGLKVRPDWRNYDTAASRTIASFPFLTMVLMALLMAPISKIPLIARAWGRSQARGAVKDGGKRQSLKGVVRTKIVVDERNEIAAKAALSAQGDVVMVWGHAHLDGIDRWLQANGFTLQSVSWRELLRAP